MLKSKISIVNCQNISNYFGKKVLKLSLHDIIQDNVYHVVSVCKWIYSPLEGYPCLSTQWGITST